MQACLLKGGGMKDIRTRATVCEDAKWLFNAGFFITWIRLSDSWFVMGCHITEWPMTWKRQNEITCIHLREIPYMCSWWGVGVLWGALWGAIHMLLTWHISTTPTSPCFFLPLDPSCLIMKSSMSYQIWINLTRYKVNFGTSFRWTASVISDMGWGGRGYSARQVLEKHGSTLVCLSLGAMTQLSHIVQYSGFHTTVHAALGLQWIIRPLM